MDKNSAYTIPSYYGTQLTGYGNAYNSASNTSASTPAVMTTSGQDQYQAEDYVINSQGAALWFYSNVVTVNWGGTPSLVLSAGANSLSTGQTTDLTATGSDLPSGCTITITDVSGDSTPAGSNAQSSGSNPFFAPATDNNAQTVTYQAHVVDANGVLLATSGTVAVTWTKPVYVSLSTSATQLFVGQYATLSATTQNMPSGDTLVMQDQTGAGTFSGANQQTTSAASESANVTTHNSQTITYQAIVYNSSGQTVAQSSTVQVSWQGLSVSLSASPTSMDVGQQGQLIASAPVLPSGTQIRILDISDSNTFYGSNSYIQAGTPAVGYVKSAVTRTTTYQAQIIDGSGNILATSNTVSVTWQGISISLSDNPSTLYTGQSSSLTATASMLPSGDLITITDRSGDLTFQGNNTYTQGGNPATAQAIDNTPQSVSYQAQVTDSQGDVLATSNSVSVTWQGMPYGFISDQIIHTPGWLRNLNTWNINTANPPRTTADWWSGEDILLQAQVYQVQPVQSVSVSMQGLSYHAVALISAPSQENVQLTYSAATGFWTGQIADTANLQYLQDGNYSFLR